MGLAICPRGPLWKREEEDNGQKGKHWSIHALPQLFQCEHCSLQWELGVMESSYIQLLTQLSIPALTLPFLLTGILKLSYGSFLWPIPLSLSCHTCPSISITLARVRDTCHQ